MPAISLTFSDASKRELYKMYRVINKKLGVPILQMHKLLEPHITLYLTKHDEKEEKIIRKAIDKIVKKNKKITVSFEGIGIFYKGNNKWNLHFNTPYNTHIQKIHKEVWKELEGKILTLQKEHYHHTSFIPHISIPVKKKKNNKTIIMNVMKYMLDFNFREISMEIDKVSYIYGSMTTPQIYYAKKL